MSSGEIFYVVIALTKTEAEKVISKLNKDGITTLAKWLEDYKDKIYGDVPEDWKPFGEQKITDIINENITESPFKSQTHITCELDTRCTSDLFNGIHICFIDLFAMFIEKYENFAIRNDNAFCEENTSNCCFLINYTLPMKVQEQLERVYREKWESVSQEYPKGALHRIAVRVDDVKNFKNYFKKRFENIDRINPKTEEVLIKKYGPPQECPLNRRLTNG